MNTTTVATEAHIHKDFIDAAQADGWTVTEGPWGYAENHERSVTLTKHFPKLNGSVVMWLTHRNIGNMVWSNEQSRWVTTYAEDGWFAGVEAWHKPDAGGDRGLSVTLADVLEKGLDEGYWFALANTCDNCGKVAEHMNHIAFANKACDDCAPAMRAKMERPGWYN